MSLRDEPPPSDPENMPDDESVVPLPLEDTIDLHPFRPRDIPDVVEEYLVACHRAGFREVRIIHGKGIGYQRERVRDVLRRLDFVSGFSDAPPERGHWGATIVRLT